VLSQQRRRLGPAARAERIIAACGVSCAGRALCRMPVSSRLSMPKSSPLLRLSPWTPARQKHPDEDNQSDHPQMLGQLSVTRLNLRHDVGAQGSVRLTSEEPRLAAPLYGGARLLLLVHLPVVHRLHNPDRAS